MVLISDDDQWWSIGSRRKRQFWKGQVPEWGHHRGREVPECHRGMDTNKWKGEEWGSDQLQRASADTMIPCCCCPPIVHPLSLCAMQWVLRVLRNAVVCSGAPGSGSWSRGILALLSSLRADSWDADLWHAHHIGHEHVELEDIFKGFKWYARLKTICSQQFLLLNDSMRWGKWSRQPGLKLTLMENPISQKK